MDKIKRIAPWSTTGIGSLPYTLTRDAVELSLRTFDIPFWPQLPNLGFREFMVPQYSEGMPGIRIDAKRERIWVERDAEEIERFYESCGPEARIAISEDYAKGLHVFLDSVKTRILPAIKGHVTGPVTFTLGLTDDEGKAVYYDEELRELSLMLLKAKVRWQVDQLKHFAREVLIFIDEPSLSALGGSAYMGVSRDETLRLISEVAQTVRDAGALAGIHCCGRADWPMVLEAPIDIMNFDAYDYGDTLGIYPGEVTEFLTRGGLLAWGIVPTNDEIKGATIESVSGRFRRTMDVLSERIPGDLLRSNIILTPSCGTGSRTVDETLKIFQILTHLKEEHC